MTTAAPPIAPRPPRQFADAAQWLAALGDVPLERILFDPWPGTATEADLLRSVENRGCLCELIDGTLVEKPVGHIESIIALYLAIVLGAYVQRTAAGVISGADGPLRMSDGRVRLPDLAFVSMARLPATIEPIPTRGPDLAVEVLSKSNTPGEISQKLREYFASGTRLAWIMNPRDRTVAVHGAPDEPTSMLDETDHLAGEPILPGFSMAVADLFRNIPPTT